MCIKYSNISSGSKEETDYLTIYSVSTEEKIYRIAFTKRKANKRVRIHCIDNQIVWEQVFPLGRSPLSVRTTICQPTSIMSPDKCCIIVISGKPDHISGLDEGFFASAKRFTTECCNKSIYVMSEKAFRRLISDKTIKTIQ